jgi:hypothetical protein
MPSHSQGAQLACRPGYGLSSLGFLRRVRKIAKSDYYVRHVRPSVRPSACLPLRNNLASTGRIFIKFDI